MKLGIWTASAVAVAALLTIAMLTTAGWDRPPIEAVQTGYRGVAMEEVYNPREVAASMEVNQVPPPPWPIDTVDMSGPPAGEIYENVEVLGDLSVDQFGRLMTAMSEWVVGDPAACDYCHNLDNLADDSLYTFQVSRRMLEMTEYINADWGETHVAPAGVSCYTCHRGNPVPEAIWFEKNVPIRGIVGNLAGQNTVSIGDTSLPFDPFTPFLVEDNDIRVHGLTALPTGNRTSIKQTEWTFSLMIHMSEAMGVNCTYCHNSRAFYTWDQVPPQRETAWHAIRMVRALNNDYLIPLQPVYPEIRLGPDGDAPKANCTTCHYGVNQPLYGGNVIDQFPSLMGPGPAQEARLSN